MRNGHIKRITDGDIQSSVLEIMSSNVSTTYITCPADPTKTLGIKLPFLVMIIKNLKKYFSFEVQVLDDKNVRRRFRASNYQVSCSDMCWDWSAAAGPDSLAALPVEGDGGSLPFSDELLRHVQRTFAQTAWQQHPRAQALCAGNNDFSCSRGVIGYSAALVLSMCCKGEHWFSPCAARVSTGAWPARPREHLSMLVRCSAGPPAPVASPVMAATAAV